MNNLANIWKRTNKGLKKCRMFNLKSGDRFVYQAPDRKMEFIATSLPFKNEEGIWSVKSEKIR